MNSLLAFAMGVILTLNAATYLAPTQTPKPIQQVEKTVHIQQIVTTIDIDELRDTKAIDPDLDEQLAHECTIAIKHHTGEPLAGIVFYVNRYWAHDACAALEHHLTHGWY